MKLREVVREHNFLSDYKTSSSAGSFASPDGGCVILEGISHNPTLHRASNLTSQKITRTRSMANHLASYWYSK